jgi:sulfatase modifying factor 1
MKRTSIFIFSLIISTSLQSTAAWARADSPAVQTGPNADLEGRIKALATKVKRSLRPLKGGTFDMGDWGTQSGQHYDIDTWSRPLHKVTLDGFSMMAYKVTYEDFDIFTDATGNERINMDEFSLPARQPKRPAGVSWYGAKAYCQWLGILTKMPFDLPTEAQWEYAARSGGKRVLFATDNGKLERPRNFPKDWRHEMEQPPPPEVGTYPANPAGLFGMSEDNGEWVDDWFDEEYYKKSPKNNPLGPATGTKKVSRGSVGGIAEISAMVFMRSSRIPQPKHDTYPNGIDYEKRVEVPFSGYSGYISQNFRCAVRSSEKIK